MRELRSHLGRHQPMPIDPEAEKRKGWRDHGILVVAEEDLRLSWPERELIRQLGARLYGCRPREVAIQAGSCAPSRSRGGSLLFIIGA
jgi:hypothetical protein